MSLRLIKYSAFVIGDMVRDDVWHVGTNADSNMGNLSDRLE